MADKFQLKAILSAVDKITPTLKNVTRGIKVMHKSLRDIGNAGGELMRKIGIPAFLSFTAITYGAIRATKFVMDYASTIQDASDRTGAGVENYQALTNMLGLVGGTAEDSEMSLTKFNKGIAEAAGGGNKDFSGLMKKLHIPLKNAKGELIGLTDALPQLAAGFAKNKNPAIQTRMAMVLWGKSGTKMIPVMKGLADGSISMADAMKMVVSKQAINDLDNMGDSITALETKTKNTLTNAIAKMVPAIQPIIDSMSKWVTANQDLIQSTIVGTLTEIADAVKKVNWIAVIKDIKETIKSIAAVIDKLGGLKVILLGLGIAWIAGPIAAIGTIIGAVFRLGAALTLVLGPWALLAGAIAGIGLLIYSNWDSIGPTIMSGLAPLIGAMSTIWDSAKQLFSALGNLVQIMAPVLIPIAKVLAFIMGQVLLLAIESIILVVNYLAKSITFVIDSFTKFFNIVSKVSNLIMPDWLKKMVGSDTKIAITAPQSAVAKNYSPLEPNNQIRPNFLSNNQTKVNGEVVMRFENAPAGFRVDSSKTNQPGLNFNPDVGYRPLAL